MRVAVGLLPLAVTLALTPLDGFALAEDKAAERLDVNMARKMVQPEQFCLNGDQMSYMPNVMQRKQHPYLAEWANQRRFIVERLDEGVTVKIVPPPAVRDTRSAVRELSTFFSLVSLECPPGAETLEVLSTGVEGLGLIFDEQGEPDFEFTP